MSFCAFYTNMYSSFEEYRCYVFEKVFYINEKFRLQINASIPFEDSEYPIKVNEEREVYYSFEFFDGRFSSFKYCLDELLGTLRYFYFHIVKEEERYMTREDYDKIKETFEEHVKKFESNKHTMNLEEECSYELFIDEMKMKKKKQIIFENDDFEFYEEGEISKLFSKSNYEGKSKYFLYF